MPIHNASIANETAQRLHEYTLPDNVMINLGNTGIDETLYKNHIIINSIQSIKKCKNKKKTAKILGRLSIKHYHPKNPIVLLNLHKGIYLRTPQGVQHCNTLKEYAQHYRTATSATIKQDTAIEYRTIMLWHEPIRIQLKHYNGQHTRKLHNTTWEEIPIHHFDPHNLQKLSKATRKLKIHLCGIDHIVTKKGQWKILEINTAPGMNHNTLQKITKKINEVIP